MQSHFQPPPPPPPGWWPPSEWHWLSDRLHWLERSDQVKTVAIARLEERDRHRESQDRRRDQEIRDLRLEARRRRDREAAKTERKGARRDIVKLTYVAGSIVSVALYLGGRISGEQLSTLMSVLLGGK